MNTIDLNVDMGESFGNWSLGDDEGLLEIATSANIACGFHAGDPLTMLRTVSLASTRGVAIGAHPGFPDVLGFGRRRMDLSPDDAYAYLVYQAGALQASAALHGESLHHVKPHGALCALLRESDEVGDAFARAMEEAFPGTFLYFPAPVETAAVCVAAERRGISVIGEIYPDLSYREDGDVIVERRKSATDAGEAAAQVLRFLESGEVRTVAGTTLALRAQSICIHGDGPNATEVADRIRGALAEVGVSLVAPPG